MVVVVYEFFQEWCYYCTQYVISFEMQTLYGNSILICVDYLFSSSKLVFVEYDHLFPSR